jgi:hypothetical protein
VARPGEITIELKISRAIIDAKERYLVPRGPLSPPLDMDGKELRLVLEDTREEVVLRPALRILAVRNGEMLCRILREHYEEQLIEIRRIVDGCFRQTIGIHPTAATVESLLRYEGESTDGDAGRQRQAAGAGAVRLAARIAVQTGLELHWRVDADAESERWLRKVQETLPQTKTLSFHPRCLAYPFQLTFSLRPERPSLRYLHVLRRRAAAGLAATAECDAVFERVHRTLDPAISGMGDAALQSPSPEFWAQLGSYFARAVGQRVESEFGYLIRVHDFKPEVPANRRLIDIHLNDPKLVLEDITRAKARLDDAEALLDGALKESRSVESQNVTDALKLVDAMRARFQDAVKNSRKTHQGQAVIPSAQLGDPKYKAELAQALESTRCLLNLPPNTTRSSFSLTSEATKSLSDEEPTGVPENEEAR